MIPDRVKELVEQFREHRDSYKSTDYKEHELEQDFINPFWEALGWDVTNKQGLAQGYRDVIVQPGLRIDGTMKAPDYVFRAGSEKKFYLEVKAPKVNLAKDPAPAYQLKRYSWTAGLSISLLSDFEEFAVYQTTAVPKPTDAPFKDRIEFFNFEQYEEKWDWLWENFSREAIWKGRFDKYAAQAKGKRGTTPFDKAFLADMHDWRKRLAENIALRNKGLSEAELNFAVQVTLDRIIMLRICEDRKIEQYGNLALDAGLGYVIQGTPSFSRRGQRVVSPVYPNLLKRFAQADDRFNSGLFHFKKEKGRDHFDALTPRLAIDDKVLIDIIKHLYYPESPYAFDIVPSDILGHVYEKFLGQVITLTKGGNARVEDKPEVKKAGGVYYTPTYIVDYIVKNTVGKLLNSPSYGAERNRRGLGGGPAVEPHVRSYENRTTPQPPPLGRGGGGGLPTLKILDPACGSGSFLLGAYQYLLDWYLRYYHENNPESWAKKKVLDRIPTGNPLLSKEGAGGGYEKEYHLSIAERKRILLEHIHGVDIDSSAVEVAKLNLMLKVLEGGAQSGVKSEHRIAYDVSERLLPDLDKNIVCGNSLIGLDYFDQLDLNSPSYAAERSRRGQASPTMRGDGSPSEPDMAERAKINAMDWKDAFPDIMKRGGFDVVIGNPPYVLGRETFDDATKNYFSKRYVSYGGKFDLYVYFVERAFSLLNNGGILGYIVPNTILVNENASKLRGVILTQGTIDRIKLFPNRVFENAQVESAILCIFRENPDPKHLVEIEADPNRKVMQSAFIDGDRNRFNVGLDEAAEAILKKIKTVSKTLGELSDICIGIQLGGTGHKTVKENFITSEKLGNEYKPVLDGKDISRYEVNWGGKFVRYGNWLHRPRNPKYFLEPKVMIRQIGATPIATFDDKGFYTLNTIYDIISISDYSPKYFLAIIGSRLGAWMWRVTNQDYKTIFPKIKKSQLENLSIRRIDVSDPTELKRYSVLINHVDSMLRLKEQWLSSTTQDRTILDRQLSATDREIDKLVYELYGLTEEEINIVEGE